MAPRFCLQVFQRRLFMGANIEVTMVSQKLEAMTRKEVNCIFCGLPTPVPAPGPGKFAGYAPSSLSIVRCNLCGKEAPYRASEVLEFDEI
jgi:hypothetical protein